MEAKPGSPESPVQGLPLFLDLRASPEPRVPPPFPRDGAPAPISAVTPLQASISLSVRWPANAETFMSPFCHSG